MTTIRELRASRHLTQFELAALVGVRPESIHKWESGRTIPYARHVRKLAEVFNVDADEIEFDEGKEIAA